MSQPAAAPGAVGLIPRGRTAGLLALLVLAAVCIRVDLLRNTSAPIPPAPAVSDAGAYRLIARNLADGDGYLRPFDLALAGRRVPTAEYPPGYPTLLAAADLVGVGSETGQRLILCGIGGVTVGLVGLIARRLGGDRAGLLAATVAALHPSLWSTDTAPLAESPAAMLAMAAVLAALAVHDHPRPWRWALLGVVAGIGGLVRTEVLLIGLLLIAGTAWQLSSRPWRQRVGLAAVGVVGLVAAVAPWTIRNAVTFGQFVPISNNAGSVARGANCDGAYEGRFKGLWVTNVSETGGDQVDPAGRCFTGFDLAGGQNEAEAASALRADGSAYVRDHLGQVPGVIAARVGRTVGLYRFDQQVNFARFEGRTARWDRWGTRLFQALSVIALLGALAPWRSRGLRWTVVTPIVAVALTVVVTYGNLRFRAVADPAVVVLAALATIDAWRRWSRPHEPAEPVTA